MQKAAFAFLFSITLVFSLVKPAQASTISTISFYRSYLPPLFKFIQERLYRSPYLERNLNPTPSATPTDTITPTVTPTPTLSLTPSIKPEVVSITLSPTPTTTLKPTSTPSPTPSVNPTPNVLGNSSDLIQNYIMDEINIYRRSVGLSDVQTDSYTCNFAKIRAKEISTNFSHDGFESRMNSHTLPYPSFSTVTENIAYTSNYKNVVSMWKNSSGHAANMRKDTPFVCVEQYGLNYAYEGWKP